MSKETLKCADEGCGMDWDDFNHVPDEGCFSKTISFLRFRRSSPPPSERERLRDAVIEQVEWLIAKYPTTWDNSMLGEAFAALAAHEAKNMESK